MQLFLPLAHLDWVHRMVGGNLLKGLAAAHHFHSDLCLELWTVSSTVAHRWDAFGWGGAPPQRLTMDPVQKSQTSSLYADFWDVILISLAKLITAKKLCRVEQLLRLNFSKKKF